jgi:hypothetical protein
MLVGAPSSEGVSVLTSRRSCEDIRRASDDRLDMHPLTLGERIELEQRIRRDGLSSLTSEERSRYLATGRAIRRVFPRPVRKGWAQTAKAFAATTPSERRRFPHLTPQRVLDLRRPRQSLTSMLGGRPQRRSSRRRSVRTVQRPARSPGRSSDPDEPEPPPLAFPGWLTTASIRCWAHERRRVGARATA